MTENNSMKTGTTTVGLVARDCVVLAADMRASMGHLAYDEESPKLYKITDNTALTNAGSVGDGLTLIRFLRAQAKLYETERDTKISVKAIATFLSNVLNSSRYYPFGVQFIIGGMNNAPELFELDALGGSLERKKYAVSGSGTELAMTTLDQNYKDGMQEEEAIAVAVKAIQAGKKRDIFSGGKSVSVIVIGKSGVRELDQKTILKYVKDAKDNDLN